MLCILGDGGPTDGFGMFSIDLPHQAHIKYIYVYHISLWVPLGKPQKKSSLNDPPPLDRDLMAIELFFFFFVIK